MSFSSKLGLYPNSKVLRIVTRILKYPNTKQRELRETGVTEAFSEKIANGFY